MTNKKLIYIANARFPTEKAHGLQIAKMCEAFAELGYQVELWVPQRKNHLQDNPFVYYQVKQNFVVRYLPVWDLIGTVPRLGFWVENATFALKVLLLLSREPAEVVIYSRDQMSLSLIQKFTSRRTYFEFHVPPKNIRPGQVSFWKKNSHIFAINKQTATFLLDAGIPADRVSFSPSALDPNFIFSLGSGDTGTARQKLSLSVDKKVIVYTGHLYPEKGVDTLLEASALLSDDYLLLLVGGTPELIARYQVLIDQRQLQQKVQCVGWVSHERVVDYLIAADMLIIPNSAKFSHSNSFTSPMKLYEYMVARRPIIASDVPALREILDDSMAYFFEADNSESLAACISDLGKSSEISSKIEAAYQRAKDCTWEQRAKNICSYFV